MMKSCIVALSLALSVFAQKPTSGRPERGAGMSITFRDPKIPGVSIKTSAGTPNFGQHVATHLGRQPHGIAASQIRWSMLLKNVSGKEIVSLTVASDIDGHRGYSYFGTFPFRRGPYIPPGEEILLFTHAAIGKDKNDPTADELGFGMPQIEEALSKAINTSIWVDSVLFQDGSFFGVDEADSFTRIRTAVDMYANILDRLAGLNEIDSIKVLEDIDRSEAGKPYTHIYLMGPHKAFRSIWVVSKTGLLRQSLEEHKEILSSVGPLYRGLKQ